LPSEDFDVDYRVGGWRLTNFEQAIKNDTELPYPLEIHPLPYKIDKNWFIEFQLASGGKLVVPCLEFFSRCYGRSQEVKRILATYPWSGLTDSCESKFYAPLDEPEEAGKWKVKLRKRLQNGDTAFLAHAKYDPYTREAAKLIHSEIEANYVADSTIPLFIKIAPWFQGPAEIRAKGIWFDNKRSFLALEIMGGSDPDGIEIERHREIYSSENHRDTGDVLDETWGGVVSQGLIRPPDIVDLTGDLAPDHDSTRTEILDQDYVVMGIPRAIVDRRGDRVTNRSRRLSRGADALIYSSGEAHGTNKGVGLTLAHAKPVIESKGILIDMWNAMRYLQKMYPRNIQGIDWFTYEDHYQSAGIPKLIALDQFDDDTVIPTATKNWIYSDVDAARIRGVMVVRMRINGRSVHIIELQRRPRKIKLKDNREVDGEEPFKGVVITIEDNEIFFNWLKRFLYEIRYVKGIAQKITPYAPGKADTFSHTTTESESAQYAVAVENALGKIGMTLGS
jgi:hypothetical protein